MVGHPGTLLPALYQIESAHWWSAGMRQVTHALLTSIKVPPGPILEIGCGGGTLLAEIAQRRPRGPVLGIDLQPIALVLARERVGNRVTLVQANLHHLPLPAASCATIIALDLFDQQGVGPARGLAESQRVLKPNGLLLVRVSAYSWLSGPHDRAFGTGRRFVAPSLRRILLSAGFKIERLTYANSLLLLPGLMLRFVQQVGIPPSPAQELDMPRLFNRILTSVLALEARWLRYFGLPAGLSIYALARRVP